MDSIHSKLADYHPASRHFKSQVNITLCIGFVATLFNLAFVLLLPQTTGPLYWFLSGTCLGFFFIFIGSYGLQKKCRTFGWLGKRLHPTFDRWFPQLHFWFRHLFLVFVFTAIWFQLTQQGMPTSLAHQISILILVIYTPFRRLIHERSIQQDNRRWELIEEWAGFFMVTVLFICIGLTLSQYVMPNREVRAYEPNKTPYYLTMAVWVMVSLTILSRLVLLIDRIRRNEKR